MRTFFSTTLYDYAARTQYVDITHGEAKRVVTMMGGETTVATQAAMDTWGNVRIPALEYLNGYDPEHPTRWVKTPWDQKILNYSSLLGDRVHGVDRSVVGNTTFRIESSYQHYSVGPLVSSNGSFVLISSSQCIPWFQLNATAPAANTTRANKTIFASEADVWFRLNTGKNYTQQISRPPPRRTQQDRTFIVARALQSMTTNIGVPELIFASAYSSGTRLSVTKCTAKTTYVEARVICDSKGESSRSNCGVYQMREISDPPTDPSVTVLDYQYDSSDSFTYFMDALDVVPSGKDYTSNTENYLVDPFFAFTNSVGRNLNEMLAASRTSNGESSGRNAANEDLSEASINKVPLHSVDIRTFERRFSLLWNTLWKIGWARESITGGDFDKGNSTLSERGIATVKITKSRVKVPLPPVYTINRTWMQLYFISADVMLLAAIFAFIMRWHCQAPAVLGYASSLIRDSAYFDDRGIYGNSVEDGPEKTRRLGKMMVMVADVSSDDPVAGKIAFAPCTRSRRVKTQRWYN